MHSKGSSGCKSFFNCAFEEEANYNLVFVENRRFTIVQHSEKEAGTGLLSELENGSSVSRFHVAPILDQDGGEISCEVANRFGRDSKTFLLSIEGKYYWN